MPLIFLEKVVDVTEKMIMKDKIKEAIVAELFLIKTFLRFDGFIKHYSFVMKFLILYSSRENFVPL